MGGDPRERILDAASRLFLHYGYKRTTVDDIASEAGMAKGSFYLHFDSKEAAFGAASQRVCDSVLDMMKQTAASDLSVEEKLHKLFVDSSLQEWDFCHQAPHAPELWSEVLAAAAKYTVPAYETARKIVADVIAEGQANGVFAPAPDARTVSELLQIATQGFEPPYILIESRQQIETRLPQLLDLFIRGMKSRPVTQP